MQLDRGEDRRGERHLQDGPVARGPVNSESRIAFRPKLSWIVQAVSK